MKKFRITFILISLLAICALTLISCSSCDNALAKPSGVMLDIETQTLKWSMVKGAQYYTVQISGQEKDITTTTTAISLEYLKEGTYEIKIKANGDGEIYMDSDWTVYEFKREHESGLKYKLINNDTEFELVGGGKASGDVEMESFYRGKPVTSIADKALYGNTKITSIKVGDNVKTIGKKAFSKCSSLKSVTIPESVVTIDEQAFQSCKALTTITLPNSVTTIAPQTFEWCSSLAKITLGNKVTSIGQYAFANCEALIDITYNGCSSSDFKACLPDSLKYIDSYAFTSCFSLSDVSVGAEAEIISEYAFSGCRSIEKIELGENLLTIGPASFANCTMLTSVSVPNSVKSIGDNAFKGCSTLGEVSLGTGLEEIGAYVFSKTKIMEEAEEMLIIDGWLIQYLALESEKLSITKDIYGIASLAVAQMPSLIQAEFKGVKYVGYASFFQCPKLYSVIFDDSLIEISNYAFYKCTFLENVILGNSIEKIGDYAFAQCSALATMTFPETLNSIGTRAFRQTSPYNRLERGNGGVVYMGGWAVDYIPVNSPVASAVIDENTRGIANYTFSGQSLLLVKIPDSVKYICRGAFYNCPAYMINLPKSLKNIGDYAFYGCSYANFGGSYYDLVIPEGTEYIGRSAFYNCTNVLSVEIPGSVNSIGAYAFYGCKALGMYVEFEKDTGTKDENGQPIVEKIPVTGYVKLGEGIESIGDRAFQGCDGLQEINIPNSVTSIGSRAFYKCPALKKITLGSGINKINDYMFYKCEALESVIVSDKLESVGNYAFRGCIALKDFDFKNVKSIGRYSFYGCSSLTNLCFPNTLTSIGDYSFRGCTEIKSIVIPKSVNTIGKHVFYGLKNTTLYCEAETIMPQWNIQFNSSYRPIFWNCTLSDDNSYVVSVTVGDDTLDNAKATNGISNPSRDGYLFSGWATEQGSTTVAYTSSNIAEATNGTVLYAIWVPKT